MEEQSTKESAKNHGFLNLHLDLYANLEKELIYIQKQNNLYIKPMFDLIDLFKKYNLKIAKLETLDNSELIDEKNKCLVRVDIKTIMWCKTSWFKNIAELNEKELETVKYDDNHWDLFIRKINTEYLWKNPYKKNQRNNEIEYTRVLHNSVVRFLDLDSEEQQEISYDFVKIYSKFSRSMSYERTYEDGARLDELIDRTKDFYSDSEIEYNLPNDETIKDSLEKFIKE